MSATDVGTAESVPMPEGRAAFLFTDIEGSTELWQHDGEAMAAALARHDERIRALLAGHRGYIFGVGGDGFFSAHESPTDALAAAIAIQDVFGVDELIRVRIGLHLTDAVRRDGAFFGLGVNSTARIAASAHGGQILMSDEMAALSPDPCADLGLFMMRGVAEPVRLWQLGSDSFPAPRSDRAGGAVTLPADRFVGRSADIADLQAQVRRHRLVTLTGTGGVGKTRMAIEAAADLAGDFIDGVSVASLASVGSADALLSAVVDAIGLWVSPNMPLEESLRRWFTKNRVLLVLDNCEHVVSAAAALAEILTQTGGASRLLATSQVPLGVRGERLVTVAPLSTTGDDVPSVELFIDRAQAVSDGFSPDSSDLEAIATICERLDHLPLAVELAAAQIRAATPLEILDRVDQRFTLLRSRNTNQEARHTTLDAAIRWSTDLLDESTIDVLSRLSVMVGHFDADMVERVVVEQGHDRWAVMDEVAQLVDRSLLSASAVDGRTRFLMLESIRAFSFARLEARGESVDRVERYVAAMYDTVMELGPQLLGPNDKEAASALDAVWSHVRAALGHLASESDTARFEEMYAALAPVWNEHGRVDEGIRWAGVVARRPCVDPVARASALGPAGGALNIRNPGASKPFNDEMIELWDRHDTEVPYCALANRALEAMLNARDEEAAAMCTRVFELSSVDDPASWNRNHGVRNAVTIFGQIDDAAEQFKEIWDREMDRAGRLGCTWHRDMVETTMTRNVQRYPELGDPSTFVRRMVDIVRSLNNPQNVAHQLTALASFEVQKGDLDAGVTSQLEALELTVEHAPGYVAQRCILIVVLASGSQPHAAARLLSYSRQARLVRGHSGSSRELRAEQMAEHALREALDDYDAVCESGNELDERSAAELARSCLLGLLSNEARERVVDLQESRFA